MRIASALPVHLLFYIQSFLDESVHGREVPASAVVYTEKHSGPLLNALIVADARNASRIVRRAGAVDEEVQNAICQPAGSCEPCPEDLLQEPFCQPFGNRRLLHCIPVSSAPGGDRPPSHDTRPNGEGHEINGDGAEDTPHAPPPHHPAGRPPQSALPAWESCGRRVPKERADFLEFVLCNVIFAALALTGVLIRSERMKAVRARRLAARIGVGLRRASSGSWAAVGGVGAALLEAESRSEEGQLMRDDVSGS